MMWRVVVQKDDEISVLQRRLTLDEARSVRETANIPPTSRVWIEPDREVAA